MVFIMWMTLMMVMMPVVVTKERPRRFKVTSRSQYLSRFDASCRIQQQSHCSLPQEFRTYWSTIWTVDCIYRGLTALVQAEDRVYVTLTPFQRCKAPAWLRNRLCGGWFFSKEPTIGCGEGQTLTTIRKPVVPRAEPKAASFATLTHLALSIPRSVHACLWGTCLLLLF